MKDLGAITDPAARWQEVLDGLRSGDTSKPDVQRALAVGEQIMGQIAAHFQSPQGTASE
jgi:hypothetical protein